MIRFGPLFFIFLLTSLLPNTKAAPIFGLWGTGKSDVFKMAEDMEADYATFTLAEAPKSLEQPTGSMLSRYPIFDMLLPWGITKTEMPPAWGITKTEMPQLQENGSIYEEALSEPEREAFSEIARNEPKADNSSDSSAQKVKGYNWKRIFGRLWAWAKILFKSFGKQKVKENP